ncbi:amphi-Trp domain-containing protein [Truepera radiovictrix]|uniref:amphi-Trp domain-containing protein n=1 Tax=Truepera radiovictrix TaxID=332249 RepID=UPI000318ED18|nr:amphi-Trp domain-containing protein [Truepera radiovictrix]WMT58204.1 amphi-Trp domain-containing protein [Truepera radiovictrix]
MRRFKSEERKSRGEVSAFLRQLADKLDEGRITLRSGGEEVVLEPPQQLTLELQVEDEEKGARGVEHSLEVELAWFDGDEGGAVELS